MRDAQAARDELTGHRHYRYRGCAPLPTEAADFPGQALGDPELPVSAWDEPADESQQAAVLAVCAACPVREPCRTAAMVGGPKSPGPEAIRGGLVGGLTLAVRARLDGAGIEAEGARQGMVEHRHYRYRGCAVAPDPAFPGQSLGAPGLSVDAWGTVDVPEGQSEPQKIRLARERGAVAACSVCPVLAECQAYGMSTTADGQLAEPAGVWGGVRSLDRHRALIARRQAEAARPADAALAECRTEQKQAVLRALAREVDEELVAFRAGMDVRTANWHRAILCGLLQLDKASASREQLLARARELGVLDERVAVRPDGRWPVAAAPNGDGSRQRRIAPGRPEQIVLPGYQHLPRHRRTSAIPADVLAAARRERRALRRTAGGSRLRLVTVLPQQLPLPIPPIALPVLEAAA